MAALRKVKVWEVPVRLVHFFNWWTVGILSVTGFDIGSPFISAIFGSQFIMSNVRLIHFIAGYVFTANFILRI